MEKLMTAAEYLAHKYELPKIYRAVDRYLDEVEQMTRKMANEFEIFKKLASGATKW